MTVNFKPTHEITVPVVKYLDSWCTRAKSSNALYMIIRCDHPLVTVHELPRPIEAGDWVTITGWNSHPQGEAFEVLHVHEGRAWIKDKDNYHCLINIEDITRTTF